MTVYTPQVAIRRKLMNEIATYLSFTDTAKEGVSVPEPEPEIDRYVVTNNTPGYLPEEDEPALFCDLEAAKDYLDEEVERFVNSVWAGDGKPSVHWDDCHESCFIEDTARPHDLGRVFEIHEVHNED